MHIMEPGLRTIEYRVGRPKLSACRFACLDHAMAQVGLDWSGLQSIANSCRRIGNHYHHRKEGREMELHLTEKVYNSWMCPSPTRSSDCSSISAKKKFLE